MDKKTFVVAIPIAVILISTLLQFFLRGREASPGSKRLAWAIFVAGAAVLIIAGIAILNR
jgi:hypothetical protein